MAWKNAEMKDRVGPNVLDLSREEDLVYWARAMNISKEELIGLVTEFGSDLREVMRAVILRDIRNGGSKMVR